MMGGYCAVRGDRKPSTHHITAGAALNRVQFESGICRGVGEAARIPI